MGGEKNGDVLLIAGCTNADVASAAGRVVPSIRAFGYVRDIRMYYAACDVVVLPSWHEGMPYSLLEGAAASRPLVGSAVPGIDSIIDDHNGVLVPPGDSDALTKVLAVLRLDRELRQRMGCAGRQLVERDFDRTICEQRILAYYNCLGIKGSAVDQGVTLTIDLPPAATADHRVAAACSDHTPRQVYST